MTDSQDQTCARQIGVVVLEDIPEQLEVISGLISKLPGVSVTKTTFGDEAWDCVFAGDIAVLVTDLHVVTKQGRQYNATRILREIKRQELFVHAVATSAYKEIDEVQSDSLAICIPKKPGSAEDVRDATAKIVEEVKRHRDVLGDVVLDLWESTRTEDVMLLNDKYQAVKKRVINLRRNSSFVPRDYRQGFFLLQNIAMTLSATPSEQFGLHRLSAESHALIAELVAALCRNDFRYEVVGLSVANKLEASGVFVRPRLNISL